MADLKYPPGRNRPSALGFSPNQPDRAKTVVSPETVKGRRYRDGGLGEQGYLTIRAPRGGLYPNQVDFPSRRDNKQKVKKVEIWSIESVKEMLMFYIKYL